MAISPRNTKKLFACLGVAAATAALGAGYSAVAGGQPLFGGLAGLIIGLLLATFELSGKAQATRVYAIHGAT